MSAEAFRADAFREGLIAELPNLRAFAVSLCRSPVQADDLVQDTVLKAWANSEKFQPGTSLRAWLFTILRNTYYSLYRKSGREVQDHDGTYSQRLAVSGEQEGAVAMAEFREALAKLSEEHREALILVGASGLSYEEASEICGVAIGTVKSRVNRARARLAELLGISSIDDLGPDRRALAVVERSPADTVPT